MLRMEYSLLKRLILTCTSYNLSHMIIFSILIEFGSGKGRNITKLSFGKWLLQVYCLILIKRGMSQDKACPRCHDHPETLMHVLRDCDVVKFYGLDLCLRRFGVGSLVCVFTHGFSSTYPHVRLADSIGTGLYSLEWLFENFGWIETIKFSLANLPFQIRYGITLWARSVSSLRSFLILCLFVQRKVVVKFKSLRSPSWECLQG